MQMIKSKKAPKPPKRKIKMPQLITPVNYHLAVSGLALMLEMDQNDFEHHCFASVASATSEHAVLLLPVLERYLLLYNTVLTNCLDLSKVSAKDSVGKAATQNMGTTLQTLTSTLRSLLLRGANVANLLENSTINTLKVVHNLVRFSSHVRNALICDTYNYSHVETKKSTTGKDTKDSGKKIKGSTQTKEGSSSSANQGAEAPAESKVSFTASQVNPQPSTSRQAVSFNIVTEYLCSFRNKDNPSDGVCLIDMKIVKLSVNEFCQG